MVFKISACYNTHLGASLTPSVIKSTSLSVLQFKTYASSGQSGSRKRLFGNRGLAASERRGHPLSERDRGAAPDQTGPDRGMKWWHSTETAPCPLFGEGQEEPLRGPGVTGV